MSASTIIFLALILSAFATFMSVLGGVSLYVYLSDRRERAKAAPRVQAGAETRPHLVAHPAGV